MKKINKSNVKKAITIAVILVIAGLTNVTEHASSSEYREFLANKLNINSAETHYIGCQDSNNGIVMTVVSSHVVNKTAVVLITFEKENGEAFGNEMNPMTDTLMINGNKLNTGFSGEYSELSEDSRILNCYFTWSFSYNIIAEKAYINVTELVCSQSQVDGIIWPDQLIEGEWTASFALLEDMDNTLTVINDDISNIVSMCGKELQINSVMVSDMLLKANTTTLKEVEMPFDPLSNVSVNSGSYSGVYIRLKYKDGTMSDNIDCLLDNDNNIITMIPGTFDKTRITEIHVGDLIINVTN